MLASGSTCPQATDLPLEREESMPLGLSQAGGRGSSVTVPPYHIK